MKLIEKKLQIAIDGPAGCGKSSLASILAQELNLTYIYTGAMYRAVAFLAQEKKIPLNDEEKILELFKNKKLFSKKPSRKHRYSDIYFDKRNITSKLFTSSASQGSAMVGKLKGVRKYLVKIQQDLAKDRPVIMDGRDIGSKVLPKADLKIYLTADLKTRVTRRWNQLKKIGKQKPFQEVLSETKKRDYQDLFRKESPLRKTADTWVLDNTNLDINEEVKVVINKLKELKLIE